MTMMQYLSTFRLYSPIVLLLALGVNLACSLLKKTVLKKLPKKAFVFLPFLIGLIVYASFRAISAGLCSTLTVSLAETLEGGFACGCAATLYYVAYEQFIRGKGKSVTPLTPLLDGIVPDGKRAEVENALLSADKQKSAEELSSFVEETLRNNLAQGISDGELLAASKLVCEYLTQLKK